MAESRRNTAGRLNSQTQMSGEKESSDDDEAAAAAASVGEADIAGSSLRKNTAGSSSSSSSEPPKREENPFSFKHFLKANPGSGYLSQGARPKLYPSNSPVAVEPPEPPEPPEPLAARITPEFPSALPDFVQDHLVVEQCYLGSEGAESQLQVDLNSLPDFAPSNGGGGGGSERTRWPEGRGSDVGPPLDLPNHRHIADFPLDLPTEAHSSHQEGNVANSLLPDFLSDGAVHSQPQDNGAGSQSPDREVERLRAELDSCRRQLNQQARQADYLQRELDFSRSREQDYSASLAKAVEQAEEHSSASNRKLKIAEATVSKLKQEVKTLNAEVSRLRRENMSLRTGEEASGGANFAPTTDTQLQRLALDLRNVATTAEQSLRQLLIGAGNLRVMADSLEGVHHMDERGEPSFLPDMDESAGPAL